MESVERPERAANAGGRWRDWSALPDLPLVAVARRLPTITDFLSFCGVCTSWRSVVVAVEGDVDLASHSPLFFAHNLSWFYHPKEKRFYRMGAADVEVSDGIAGHSHGHLILVRDNLPWIVNPLTRAEFRCFPRAELPFSQALLSSPPMSPGCVLVVYDSFSIQCCRPGDKTWSVVYRPLDHRGNPRDDVNSVALVGGKGYVLLGDPWLASFDLTGRSGLTIVNTNDSLTLPHDPRRHSLFLAESKGELFAFSTTGPNLLGDFAVSRFDFLSCEWVTLEDLGGRAVLVDRRRRCVFVDNYETWGGRKGGIYLFRVCFHSGLVTWEYKMDKDGACKRCTIPLAYPPTCGSFGVCVLPRLR